MTGFLDLSTSMTLNDFEPFQKGFLMNFSQYLDAAHISILNCDEMAGVRPRQSADEILSIKRRFQQSKS